MNSARYDFIGFFCEGFARVRLNGKWNFIDKQGNIISNQWFDDCFPFYKGFARVRLNRKYNFIDYHGYFLSDTWFDSCGGDFYNGLANVFINGIYKTINTKGEIA